MRTDEYGQIILNEVDICEAYLQDPDRLLSKTLVEHAIPISDELDIINLPQLIEYTNNLESIEEFDARLQSNWFIPDEYKDLDIAEWLLNQCKHEHEMQRVGQELLLYMERDLFMLLRYLKYLVDTLRQHNIVWGVGRGSSVSSYVLYLIGIHRIDSIFFDLDIEEFLK